MHTLKNRTFLLRLVAVFSGVLARKQLVMDATYPSYQEGTLVASMPRK